MRGVAPRDEDHSYVGGIERPLARGGSIEQVAAALRHRRLRPNDARDRAVAERPCALPSDA